MSKERVFLVFVAMLFLSILPVGVLADEITLQPDPTNGTDAYIRDDNPDNNYGTTTSLYVGLTASGNKMRDLIHFNISDVTPGSTIVNASFKIYMFLASAPPTNLSVGVHRITSSWNEGTGNAQVNDGTINGTTWNERWFETNWTSSGGDFISSPEDTINISDTLGWYTWDVRDLVQGWLDDDFLNLGLIMVSNESENGSYKGIYSSDYTTNTSRRPKLIINYATNALPTIVNVTDTSNQSSPTDVGDPVDFTIHWNDIDSSQARVFVCSSTNINYSGCIDTEFCSTTYSTTDPITCQYNTQVSDSHNTSYWVKVCDNEGNCSSISQQYDFWVNHAPNVTVIQPNGGETINQTLNGNYDINFTASDSDNNTLTVDIYYSDSSGGKDYAIIMGYKINSTNCYDPDSTFATPNNCTYSWNSTGIVGTYWMDIDITDSFLNNSDSSDGSFDVASLVDDILPNVTNISITSNLSSGEVATIRANATDENLHSVWAELNNTQGQQIVFYMGIESGDIYYVDIEAGKVGQWGYRVHANDSNGNENATDWYYFNVSKPNATTANESFPATALPNSVVMIKGELNAGNILKNVYAYLNIGPGFTFHSSYPQNSSMGNFSGSDTKNKEWFLSVPTTEAVYTFNITYIDIYSNQWNSSSHQITVTSVAASGLFVDINSQPEIVASDPYTAEILVRDGSGTFINADSVRLTLEDPLGNTIVDNVNYTSHTSTGIYNYTYVTGSGQVQGQWILTANVTYDGTEYTDRQFWKLTGGPFDVRDVVILDNTVPVLEISVTLENTGDVGQDMTVVWNLTREDNGQVLDSGSDTVLVPASSEITYTANPGTTYIGTVRITFLGYYSGTEKAGAFDVFSTSEESTDPVSPGGGGTTPPSQPVVIPETVEKIEILSSMNDITSFPGQSKVFDFVVRNAGNKELEDVSLSITGLDSNWYSISPASVYLDVTKTGTFSISIDVPVDALVGSYPFMYVVKSSGETVIEEQAELKVVSEAELLSIELSNLKKKITDLKYTINGADEKGYDVSEPRTLVKLAEDMIVDIEDSISGRDFDKVRDDIKIAKRHLDDAEDRLENLGIKILEKPVTFISEYWAWIVTWILICSMIVIVLIILKRGTGKTYKVKVEDKKGKIKTEEKDKKFSDRLKKIKEGLKK